MSTPDAFDREYIALDLQASWDGSRFVPNVRSVWVRRSRVLAIRECDPDLDPTQGPTVEFGRRFFGSVLHVVDCKFDGLLARLEAGPHQYITACGEPGKRCAVRADIIEGIHSAPLGTGSFPTDVRWFNVTGASGILTADPAEAIINRLQQVGQASFASFVELEKCGYYSGIHWHGSEGRMWIKREIVLGLHENILDLATDSEVEQRPAVAIEVTRYRGRIYFLAVRGVFEDVLERLQAGGQRFVIVDSRTGSRSAARLDTLDVISSVPMTDDDREYAAGWAGHWSSEWDGLGGHVDPAEVVIERLRQAMGEG